MNAADILILAVLGASLLFGLLRGFVSEVLSLACWIAAFWVAWAFGDRVAALYGNWLHAPSAAIIAGYVTAFLAVLVAGALLGWALRGLMNRGGLRGGDRFLGAAFGLVRGALLVTFAVLMLGFTPAPATAAWWRQSTLVPWFAHAAGWMAARLPPEVTHYLEIGGQSLPALSGIPISATDRERSAWIASKASSPAAASAMPALDHRSSGGVGQ